MPEPGSKRGRDAQKTRETILDTAEAAFAEHGFDGARIDAIARASGYNISLLFQYFGDKLGLYVAVVKRADRELNALLAGVLIPKVAGETLTSQVQGFRTFLETLVRMTFDYLVEHPRFQRILTWEMAEGWQTYARIASQVSTEESGQFETLFQETQSAGLLRSDFAPTIQLLLILHLCQSYLASLSLYQTLLPGEDLSTAAALARAREHIVGLIVAGMMSDPPQSKPPKSGEHHTRAMNSRWKGDPTMSEEMTEKNKHLYFKNPDLDYFLQYALACQTYQGSSYGECFAAVSHIDEDDLESWIQAWTAGAEKIAAEGRNAEARGHRISAREAYLRAATYYAVALIALSPRDPRFRDTFVTYRATFRRSATFQDIPFEIVGLPFDGKSLSGYFLRATGSAEQRPTLIVLGDRFAEELYFWGGAPAATRRGYHVLLIDQPGQGITPFDGLYTRADAEVPVGAMVDYLCSRSEVDPSRIALFGIASAGYMATRAVAFEKRISACIADTPLCDMESLMMAEAPAASSHLSESERALRSTLFDLTAWQVGKTQLSELFEVFKGMKVDDVSSITCPMLCLASSSEVAERIRQTRKIYELLPNPKKALHLFTEDEGADAHNQANNLSLLHAIVFDWLDEVYSVG